MDNEYPMNRNEAFGQGLPTSPSPGLNMRQMKANAAIPRRYVPQGVGQQMRYSGNGMSVTDKGRMLLGAGPMSGIMSTGNGMSADTADAVRQLQMFR
jgi:hypothetical protein